MFTCQSGALFISLINVPKRKTYKYKVTVSINKIITYKKFQNFMSASSYYDEVIRNHKLKTYALSFLSKPNSHPVSVKPLATQTAIEFLETGGVLSLCKSRRHKSTILVSPERAELVDSILETDSVELAKAS